MQSEKSAVQEKPFEKVPVEQIVSAVRSVRYGLVEIVIQDSRVIQINRTEKIRFDQADR